MTGLRCTICGHEIHAMTGLRELTKLQRHMERRHGQALSMGETMALRVKMENENEAKAQT